MTAPLYDVSCASLPPESLAALAEVRDRAGVTVALADGRAWVHWEQGDECVLRRVLPVAGVTLYARRDGRWYRHGHHLPAFDFPEQATARPLHQVLTPAPMQAVPPPSPTLRPALLALVADQRPRPATALRCVPGELAHWADGAPAGRLAQLQAAACAGRVLLLGTRLPPLPNGERFWGDGVLCPLAYRPDPDLPAHALREALGIAAGELLLLDAAGAEVIQTAAFRPLSRAGLRLTAGEAVP